MDRFDARKKVVADMEEAGLLQQIEEIRHTVPHGDRSGVEIEPWLTDQWYCDAKTLAKPAIEAVETGKTQFVPKSWENTYFDWMRNIQPWCISRQLWWGHQIPAWYGPDGTVFVEETEAAAQAAADAHYGAPTAITRDEDVLDTWFSSALWPFSTLGWPEKTPELDRYYASDVLVTGFDIIFFWVARMMMMGIHFLGEVPFSTVYIHALVRDQHGAKMSKSKGNVMDPIGLIEKFGTDALRFTLAAMAAQGRDIKLAESRIEGYRNFTTKLWNAARYAEMNACRWDSSFDPKAATQTVNRWIISELAETEAKVSKAIDSYRFNDAASALYQFIWGTYCDWYLEFTKPILAGADKAAAEETRKTTAWVLMQAINLLNPLMPFITEELWSAFGGEGQLITTSWPTGLQEAANVEAIAEMDWVVRLISEVRSIRSEMNVPKAAKIDLMLKDMSALTARRLERHRDVIIRLARLETISATDDVPVGAIQGVIDETTIVLPIADVVDLAQERVRLEKDLGKLDGAISKLDEKLSNESFISRAPAEVVEENRERLADEKARRDKLAAALERIAAI